MDPGQRHGDQIVAVTIQSLQGQLTIRNKGSRRTSLTTATGLALDARDAYDVAAVWSRQYSPSFVQSLAASPLFTRVSAPSLRTERFPAVEAAVAMGKKTRVSDSFRAGISGVFRARRRETGDPADEWHQTAAAAGHKGGQSSSGRIISAASAARVKEEKMALTRGSKELGAAAGGKQSRQRAELLREGTDSVLAGDIDTSKAILRDYIKTTIIVREAGRGNRYA